MKKLLLLLLIAPLFGFGQALNLPVSNVIVVKEYGQTFTVPEGKVWQLMSSSLYNQVEGFQNTTSRRSFPKIDSCITFRISGDNNYISFPDIYGYSVFPSGTELLVNDGTCASSVYTFVEFDLAGQNLAYNAPNQTTPTLYPNPTSSLLALNSDKEYDIEVYDMAGNKVMALTGNTIDMSHLSSSTYIVKALDKVENEEVSYKVVKN
jgi:hypothetical protein